MPGGLIADLILFSGCLETYYVNLGNVIGVLDIVVAKKRSGFLSLSGVFSCLHEQHG